MDKTDRKILAELQKDGRLSVTALAERVGLSLSPCHRRVRAMEDSGIICGYRAQINTRKIGLNFSAIIFVTLREDTNWSVALFEKAVKEVPQIVQAHRLFGDPGFMLQILTRDLDDFQKVYDEKLSALPGVMRLTSTMIMKTVIQDPLLEIPANVTKSEQRYFK
ncbi:AsnC family transcriptional regulator [Pantoea alhagi]|uniref:AsnC family transcriptional regulator n=1 Tax=Pantoea alhagi TaxID=1891675 RepID=A0A1W6B762_9GAMM|nr:Lrp/AsnC family transcriptional regulator [Pantoea alhagi]ARJ42936.1 AsnC family transcriptional regulator [Pantoea alhagi]